MKFTIFQRFCCQYPSINHPVLNMIDWLVIGLEGISMTNMFKSPSKMDTVVAVHINFFRLNFYFCKGQKISKEIFLPSNMGYLTQSTFILLRFLGQNFSRSNFGGIEGPAVCFRDFWPSASWSKCDFFPKNSLIIVIFLHLRN